MTKCKIQLAVAIVVWATPMGQGLVAAPQQAGQQPLGRSVVEPDAAFVRYHIKEARPLRLDSDRIAVRGRRRDEKLPLPPSLDAKRVEPMAVAGWSLIRLVEPSTPTAIASLVEELAAGDVWDFITPVFVDELGGPLLITPQILVQFEASVDATHAQLVLESAHAGSVLERDWAGMPGAYRIASHERSGLRALAIANDLARRSEVRFAEPDFLVSCRLEQSPPSDPSFDFSWALYSSGQAPSFDADFDMGALDAWRYTMGDPSIRVLILDVGIDPLHPDLNQDPGADFTGEGGGGAPMNACDNHGTQVAGCVSAIANNGIGSAGIAPLCKVVSARVMISNPACDNTASVQASWIVDALAWSISQGILITNASFAMGSESGALDAMYKMTRDDYGAVHFGASGNQGKNGVSYPARIPEVNAVGATTYNGHRATWSNYGTALDFVAPGDVIFTTDRSGSDGQSPGDYFLGVGTSYASPLVAGVAALIRSLQPELPPAMVEHLLRASARDLETPGPDNFTGSGMIRADRAVALALGATPMPTGSQPLRETYATCDSPSFSDDGRYVAFSSYSPHLVAHDTNGERDVFVLDNLTCSVELVSVDSSGMQSNGDSRHPEISADGRYIAFESWASNLVSGDTNGKCDIFLRDTVAGTTICVSRPNSGAQSNGESSNAAVSADGRYIAFESDATNLDPAARNGLFQIYVRDVVDAKTRLVSKTPLGVAGDAPSIYASISGDGTKVAFMSWATNLVSPDGSSSADVLVQDAVSGALERANVDQNGQQGLGFAGAPVISRDGTRVAFSSTDPLDPHDSNGVFDAYVRDLLNEKTLAVGTSANGDFGSRETIAEALSSDGHYAVFTSADPSLVPGHTGEWVDVFRKDLSTRAVELISVGSSGQQAAAGSGHPWISPEGDLVGFISRDDALTPGDALDGFSDVYMRIVSAQITLLLTPGS